MHSWTWKLACALWIIYTLGRTWNLKSKLLSFSHSPYSVHLSLSLWFFVSYTHWHKHIQTFFISLFPFALPPLAITMTLVLPTYFLSPSLLLVLSVVLLSVLLSCLDVIYVMGCEVYLSPPLHTHTHTHTLRSWLPLSRAQPSWLLCSPAPRPGQSEQGVLRVWECRYQWRVWGSEMKCRVFSGQSEIVMSLMKQ